MTSTFSTGFASDHQCTMRPSLLKSCIKECWLNASLSPHFPSVYFLQKKYLAFNIWFGRTAGRSTNIYIFQIKISQWRGRLWKKVILSFFMAMVPFVIPKNFNLHRPPLHIFCPYLQDFWQISDADIFHLDSLRPVKTWLMYIWSKLSKN